MTAPLSLTIRLVVQKTFLSLTMHSLDGQQFQIRHYMGVSAFLIEIGFNKLGLFYRLDKSEEVCMLEKRLGDVD